MAETQQRPRRRRASGGAAAANGSGGSKAETAKAKAKDRVATKFVVLRGIKVRFDRLAQLQPTVKDAVVCPSTGTPLAEAMPGAMPSQIAWLPVLNTEAAHGPDGEVRIITAKTQDEAIEQVTGKAPKVGEVVAEGEGPTPGQWKAVALSSWKGGLAFEPPKQVTMFGRAKLDG
jgi:hypothetical protein